MGLGADPLGEPKFRVALANVHRAVSRRPANVELGDPAMMNLNAIPITYLAYYIIVVGVRQARTHSDRRKGRANTHVTSWPLAGLVALA